MNSSNLMDKKISQFSKSQTQDFLVFTRSPYEEESEDEDTGWGSMDCIHSIKENNGDSYHVALISTIDRKMKKHVDCVLHAVEGISARVSQLESRTRQLENAFDDLKASIEYKYGRTDSKLRELENNLTEVQGGIQDLRDQQEIAEAKLQLAKLQMSKGGLQLGNQNRTVQTDSAQKASLSVRQQSEQLPTPPVACPQLHSSIPPHITPNLPTENPSPKPLATSPQLPTQLLHIIVPPIPQPESSHTPLLTPETTQRYHMPSSQQSQPPPSALHQTYQPTPRPPVLHQSCQAGPQHPIPQSSQLPQMYPPHRSVNTLAHHPLSHQPEDVAYMGPQGNLKYFQPPGRASPVQQFFLGSTQQLHDQPSSRPYSEFPSRDLQPPCQYSSSNLYPYDASSASYGGSTIKSSQLTRSPSVPGSEVVYSRLPTTKILPHALPTASSVDNGSGSGESANRVPIDDVVDKVVAMGFRRDLVKATVRKLTANGQSVDLNVVLDKLMNNEEA